MSNYEREIDDAADARFNDAGLPLCDGEHIGNDHQVRETTTLDPAPFDQLPKRRPNGMFDDIPMMQPINQQGLQWSFTLGGPVLFSLATVDWRTLEIHNIELRTIHAHLMETVANVRAELRHRGLVVDL